MMLNNPDQKITYNEMVRIPDTRDTYFKVSQFGVIKLIVFWVVWLNQVRLSLGMPLVILTAYRDVMYELSKNRSGKSQHTFQPGKNHGATDIRPGTKGLTIKKHNFHMVRLFDTMMGMALRPRRIAYYANDEDKYAWFHIDFHPDVSPNSTQLFFGKADGTWEHFTGTIETFAGHIQKKTLPK